MGVYIAQRLVKLLIHADVPVRGARVALLGLTFKENVPDLRNSRVPDILAELRQYGIEPMIHDPVADAAEAFEEYGVRLAEWSDLYGLDGMVLAVPHRAYLEFPLDELRACLCAGGVLVDVKSAIDPSRLPSDILYWSL